jgi:hypothetical protein
MYFHVWLLYTQALDVLQMNAQSLTESSVSETSTNVEPTGSSPLVTAFNTAIRYYCYTTYGTLK